MSISKRGCFEHVEPRLMLSAVSFENHPGPADDGDLLFSRFASVSHAADLDGDSDLDVVVIGLEAGKVGGKSAYIYKNADGKGDFVLQQVISGHAFQAVDSGDIDGDGDVDLVFDVSGDSVWLENLDGLGDFGLVRQINHLLQEIHLADFDGDTDLDILSVAGFLQLSENTDGLGNFSAPTVIEQPKDGEPHLAVGDIDGNGTQDIVFVEGGLVGDNIDPTFQWYPNQDGTGEFGTPRQIGESPRRDGRHAEGLEVADLDRDGDLDIVLATPFDGFVWYENLDGQGLFGSKQLISSQRLRGSLEVADMDLDGDLDIVSGIWPPEGFEDPHVVWYENLDGRGTFDDVDGTHIIDEGFGRPRFVVADVDGDRDMDVVSLYDWFESDAAENAPLPGDLDSDGEVDFEDFLILASNFGRSDDVTREDGDLDEDGEVAFSDFLVLANNFGRKLVP